MLPPPGEISESRSTASARIAPIVMNDERVEEGSRVELAGLVRVGVAVWCPEAQAKATVLTMVNMDSGYVGVLMVSGKSPYNFTARSSSSFVDKLRAEKTRLRYDNEPAMRLLAEKIAAFRHPRTTILEPINRAEHQSVGGVERAHQSIQAATRALRLDIRTRTGEDIAKSRAEHIKHLLDTGAVKDWNREDAIKT